MLKILSDAFDTVAETVDKLFDSKLEALGAGAAIGAIATAAADVFAGDDGDSKKKKKKKNKKKKAKAKIKKGE